MRVDEGGPPAAEALLSADERRRAARFLRPADRRRYVEARAALRTIIARYSGAGPDAAEFRAGRNGKPELGPRSSHPIQFNVTHSGDVILLAFAIGLRVGIDVEVLRPIPEAGELAQRYLTPAERRWLDAAHDRSSAFLQLWTLKEAFLKATGEGVGGLESVEVALSASGARLVAPEDGWQARVLDPAPGYVAALVHACVG